MTRSDHQAMVDEEARSDKRKLVLFAQAADRTALPIAGDDEAAKATVKAFLDAIGYDAVDTGGLFESWRFERDMPAYGLIYFAKVPVAGEPFPDGAPTSASKVASAVAAAKRPA